MANTEETRRPFDQGDGEAFKALEESLYTRLRDALEPRIDALLEARAEYLLPEYYDRVVTSEIRRIESGIEYNGRRISELRSYMDQRFDDVDKRFEQIDKRFEQVEKRLDRIDQRLDGINSTVRNWMIVGFAFLGALFTVIQLFLSR